MFGFASIFSFARVFVFRRPWHWFVFRFQESVHANRKHKDSNESVWPFWSIHWVSLTTTNYNLLSLFDYCVPLPSRFIWLSNENDQNNQHQHRIAIHDGHTRLMNANRFCVSYVNEKHGLCRPIMIFAWKFPIFSRTFLVYSERTIRSQLVSSAHLSAACNRRSFRLWRMSRLQDLYRWNKLAAPHWSNEDGFVDVLHPNVSHLILRFETRCSVSAMGIAMPTTSLVCLLVLARLPIRVVVCITVNHAGGWVNVLLYASLIVLNHFGQGLCFFFDHSCSGPFVVTCQRIFPFSAKNQTENKQSFKCHLIKVPSNHFEFVWISAIT